MGWNTRKAMLRKLWRCENAQRGIIEMLTELGTTYDEIAPNISETIARLLGTQEAILVVLEMLTEEIQGL